jgi:large subunit ribosomal protein L29
MIDAKEMRAQEPAALQEELLKLRREQFNLRMAEAAGHLPKPNQWGRVRRDIARIKTVLTEKRTMNVASAPVIESKASAQKDAAGVDSRRRGNTAKRKG